MATKLPTNSAFEDFLLSPKGDKLIRLNISRNTLIAFVISSLLHALILLFVLPKIQLDNLKEPTTFQVDLAPPQEPIAERLPEPIPEVKPLEKLVEKPKIITHKPRKNAKPPVFTVPDVLATKKPAPEKLPQPQSPANAPTDMASYIALQRAKREAQEGAAARENAVAAASEQGLTDEQKRDERIKNNLKSGTNGIFEIKRLESKSASFSFKGWTDYSNVKLQYYEVEASDGQDVRLVMMRRMIAIIREHYDGDFPWESHRLGRTIVKSARVEDSAELEDFLMQEFFGQNYKTAP